MLCFSYVIINVYVRAKAFLLLSAVVYMINEINLRLVSQLESSELNKANDS